MGPVGPGEPAAREVCLRLLTVRSRSRAELAAALQRRGVAEPVAVAVIDRLAGAGLVDDAAYAAQRVQVGRGRRSLGRRALVADLRRRGIEDDVVSAAVGDPDPELEYDAARLLATARLPRLRGLPVEAQTRRLAGLLTRKGYPAAVVRRVVSEAVDHRAADRDG
jgi:regulatory protein